MKELSIEEKAKAYDEAIKRVENIKTGKCKTTFMFTEGLFEHIFPELKESEDEDILKGLISMCKTLGKTKWIAWLEKQGENKPADKVEPKFQNGQWIVWQNKCYKVNYNGCGYELIDQNGLRTSLEYGTVDKSAHLWTIQDAKDGDIISSPSHHLIWIYKDKEHYHACVNMNCVTDNFFINGLIIVPNDVCPATKNEKNILFASMIEAGYEWNAEKKELKKNNSYCKEHCKGYQETGKCFADGDCKDKREAERKSTWSEEDEDLLFWTINNLTELKNRYGKNYGKSGKCIDWLRSLKERIGG